ncbi:MAG: HD-GYP domain-containing protein [Gammaproteobacteria bacterium]
MLIILAFAPVFMADHLITLSCDRLETGMYVAELDRSWLHTPFDGPGMLVGTEEQLAALRRCCHYVYVDPARSSAEAQPTLAAGPDTLPAVLAAHDDFSIARTTLARVVEHLSAAVQEARAHGRMELAPLRRAAAKLVEEVKERPDACLWLIRLNGASGLLYRRSLGTSIHAILFGQQLGLENSELRQLAIGGLLLDIGKTSVPVPILAKPGELNPAERFFINRHVMQGHAMVRLSEGADPRVTDMVLGHHERLDGSGYPRHLSGTEIPLFARIAGIVDTFDALTLNRRYAQGISAHDALRFLNAERGERFDAALVDEFIHALGVYPTGTRVELVDGSSGIVCSQNSAWPLRPTILLTHDSTGERLENPRLLASGMDGHIARALPPAPPEHPTAALEQAISQGS